MQYTEKSLANFRCYRKRLKDFGLSQREIDSMTNGECQTRYKEELRKQKGLTK